MPDRDRMYRIKSPLEEYERVVKETTLVRSDCYLPEEILTEATAESNYVGKFRFDLADHHRGVRRFNGPS